MAVLRFGSEEIRRACCDLARTRARWGPALARRISLRLQQLEAVETLTDLAFLPFDSYQHDRGVIEVVVADHLSLFIEHGTDTPQGGSSMYTIVISGMGARSTVAQTP